MTVFTSDLITITVWPEGWIAAATDIQKLMSSEFKCRGDLSLVTVAINLSALHIDAKWGMLNPATNKWFNAYAFMKSCQAEETGLGSSLAPGCSRSRAIISVDAFEKVENVRNFAWSGFPSFSNCRRSHPQPLSAMPLSSSLMFQGNPAFLASACPCSIYRVNASGK
jgi:hypothetical protein